MQHYRNNSSNFLFPIYYFQDFCIESLFNSVDYYLNSFSVFYYMLGTSILNTLLATYCLLVVLFRCKVALQDVFWFKRESLTMVVWISEAAVVGPRALIELAALNQLWLGACENDVLHLCVQNVVEDYFSPQHILDKSVLFSFFPHSVVMLSVLSAGILFFLSEK